MRLASTLTIALWLSATQAVAHTGEDSFTQRLLGPVSVDGEEPPALRLSERMKEMGVPLVSVAIVEESKVVFARTYGTDAVPDKDVAFQVGSLSKPVTAAIAITLSLDSRIELDAPIDLQRLGLSPVAGGIAAPPTVRQILGHNAGFTVHGFRGYRGGEDVPSLEQVLSGDLPANSEPIRIVAPPGSGLRYSGGGYVVLQKILQDATGQSFARLAEQVLFEPLGMRRSSFVLEGPQGPLAAGTLGSGEQLPGGSHRFPESAAAGLWSTASDLAAFLAWLVDEGNPVAERMVTAQRDNDGAFLTTPSGSRGGLGLVLEGEGAARRFSHSGSNPGFKALMVGFPATGQGAVIIANSDKAPQLIQEVLRAIAAQYEWPERFHEQVHALPLEDAKLAEFAGVYAFRSPKSGADLAIPIVAAEGLLLAALPDGRSLRLRPVQGGRFIDLQSGLEAHFPIPGTLRVPALGLEAIRP